MPVKQSRDAGSSSKGTGHLSPSVPAKRDAEDLARVVRRKSILRRLYWRRRPICKAHFTHLCSSRAKPLTTLFSTRHGVCRRRRLRCHCTVNPFDVIQLNYLLTHCKNCYSYLQFRIQWASIGTSIKIIFGMSLILYRSPALLYYDYVLTFPAEGPSMSYLDCKNFTDSRLHTVKYMWGRKFRFSTVLYICCRYALIANVLFLAAIAHKIPNVHKASRPFCQILCSCN